jgi:hypothetical protein
MEGKADVTSNKIEKNRCVSDNQIFVVGINECEQGESDRLPDFIQESANNTTNRSEYTTGRPFQLAILVLPSRPVRPILRSCVVVGKPSLV